MLKGPYWQTINSYNEFEASKERTNYIDTLYKSGFNTKQINQMVKFYNEGYILKDLSVDVKAEDLRNAYEGLSNKLFTDQMEKFIYRGLEDNLNVFEFANENYNESQALNIIYSAINKNMDLTYFRNTNFSGSQLHEIFCGLKKGLDVSLFAREDFSGLKMKYIRYALEEDIDLLPYISFKDNQLIEIYCGLKHNKESANNIDISLYAKKRYTAKQMHFIRQALQYNYDCSILADADFSEKEMEIIYNGLVNDLDIKLYADHKYSTDQMEVLYNIIRNNSEGRDLSLIFNNEYSPVQMAMLGFCLTDDYNQDEIDLIKDPKYSFDEMFQTIQYVDFCKKDYPIPLEKFRTLTIKEMAMINKLLRQGRKEKIKDIDINNDNIYEKFMKIMYKKDTTQEKAETLDDVIKKAESVDEDFTNPTFFLTEDNSILEVGIDFDPGYPSETFEIMSTEANSKEEIVNEFIEEWADEISEIIYDNIYFEYNEDDDLFTLNAFNKSLSGTAEWVNTSVTLNPSDLFYELIYNGLNDFLIDIKYDYSDEQFQELRECPFDKSEFLISNIDELKIYGLKTLDEQFFIEEISDSLYIYLDKSEENAESIFNGEKEIYHRYINNEIYYYQLYNQNDETIDTLYGIYENPLNAAKEDGITITKKLGQFYDIYDCLDHLNSHKEDILEK